jgi:hypothetical protein
VVYEGDSDYRNDAGEFLRGTRFSHRKFAAPKGWDHYHCECCNVKFMANAEALAADPELQSQGYTAVIDGGHGPVVYWVCLECFDDLAGPFAWSAA